MITRRIVEPEDWPSLAGTPIEPLLDKLDTQRARIVVLEMDGKIVGGWTFFPVYHAEGLWLDDEIRRHRPAWQQLALAVNEAMDDGAWPTVVTGAESENVRQILLRIGGESLPFDQYVLARPVAQFLTGA